MSIKDYFYSQFVWHLRNISFHNIIVCFSLIAGGFLFYNAIAYIVNKIQAKEQPGSFSKSVNRSEKRSGRLSRNMRALCLGLLGAYLYLVFHFTVFVRSAYSEPHYTLELFWSYKLALQGSKGLLVEIILNCIMLIPEGILLPVVLPTRKRTVKFGLTALFGLMTTCAIELLQLTLRRGLFEFDDIINNFIGILAGYFIYFVVSVIFSGLINKNKRK